MLKLVGVNASKFRDDVLVGLSNDPELYLDTSPASFVYKIIDALSTGQTDVFEAMNTLIANNTFETLEGSGLDRFFEIFNITRLQYANGSYTSEVAYSSNENIFTILEGTLVEYEDSIYVTSFKTDFENVDVITGIKLLLRPVTNQNFTFNEFLEIEDMKIDLNGVVFHGDKQQFLDDVKTSTAITTFERYSEDVETDTSFLNRAQNLFQFYSADSIEKILLSIKTLSTVNDVYYIVDGLTTKIIIIPNDISNLHKVLESAQEIVDYFKNSNVVLDEPNYISFVVTGILDQLTSSEQIGVISFIKNYFKTIYQRENKFVREDFEYKLISYIRGLNSFSSDYVNISRDSIGITYKIYAKSNFDLLISSGRIYQNDVKEFSYGIFNCDDVR